MKAEQDDLTEQMASVLAMYSAAIDAGHKPTPAQLMTLSCVMIYASMDHLKKKCGRDGQLQVLASIRAELDNMEQGVFDKAA